MSPNPPLSEALAPPRGVTTSQGYDGVAPFPDDGRPAPARGSGERLSVVVTGVIVTLPFVALGLAVWLLWGALIQPSDALLALTGRPTGGAPCPCPN
ncbi:hypothetical protein [Streptomyces sp. NPDC023838]|uniref:hypothetical protein n=1 Tax=Streptomyces sp. NPDC023838 TaxID=3154325 RepID=UPI0033C480C5